MDHQTRVELQAKIKMLMIPEIESKIFSDVSTLPCFIDAFECNKACIIISADPVTTAVLKLTGHTPGNPHCAV